MLQEHINRIKKKKNTKTTKRHLSYKKKLSNNGHKANVQF